MKEFVLIFLAVILVMCNKSVLGKASPVSQPIYANNQYVSGQQIPLLKPQAQGYLQPQRSQPPQLLHQTLLQQAQALQQPVSQYQQRPVYEQSRGEGLQNYATNKQFIQSATPAVQPQQVLLAANVDRQKLAQAGPLYLQQVPNAGLQYHRTASALAQEAILNAQRKTAASAQASAYPRPVIVQQQQQPQYVQDQPQIKYITRPAPIQLQYSNRQPQQAQHQQQPQHQSQEKESEDYPDDPNATYQFGFDVKDDLYTNYQNRKEQREGNKITGSYSVVDSDGFIRTVTYTADPKEGFKAEVTRQPTDIVVKIPKPDPKFQQRQPQQQQQYVQAAPQRGYQQQAPVDDRQDPNVIYRYQ